MTTYFMDTSAIGKRYMAEVGSTWVTSLVAPAADHVIIIAQLALVELSSALARKQRQAQISAVDVAQRRADFLTDVETLYLTVPLEESILRHTFVCADINLLNAAAAEGFVTDNPQKKRKGASGFSRVENCAQVPKHSDSHRFSGCT